MSRARPGTDNHRRHRATLLMLGLLDHSVPQERLSDVARLIEGIKAPRRRGPVKAVFDTLGPVAETTPTTLLMLELLGLALMREAKHDLAGHLFRLIAEALPEFGDPRDHARIYILLARCHRKLGNLPAALLASQAGLFAASIDDDPSPTVELLLERAAVYIVERRDGEAETILSRAFSLADDLGDQTLIARAAQDLGVLNTETFLRTGDPLKLISGLRLLDRALQLIPRDDKVDRRLRVLNDLGRAAAAGGFPELALAAYEIVYDRAGERDVRWRASINMLDVLHRIHDPSRRRRFDAMRWELDHQPIPAPLEATALAHIVEGLLAFDPEANVKQLCNRAKQIATRHDCASVLEDVEALEEKRVPPRRTLPEHVAAELRAIVNHALTQPVGRKRLRRGRRPNRDYD